MMSTATFLGGAKSRLLPASIPFRFFVAAVGFHVLAWLALLAAADELPEFSGGSGMLLAAVHLLTLGVLVMTAMGAAFQLLPVATRRPLARLWPVRLCFWLLVPGTIGLSTGMATNDEIIMYFGSGAVAASLLIFAVMIADNLRRASDLPVVAAHGWAALLSLAGFTGLGLVLIADLMNGYLPDRQSVALSHMTLAGFGFMGLLALGFSHVLIPMYALSQRLSPRLAWWQFWLAAGACALAAVATFAGHAVLMSAAAVIGLAAAGIYLWLMQTALRTGMRKRLGVSFILIKLSWVGLVLCLVLGLGAALDAPVPNGQTLFGFMLLISWLLTFLTGILQRIMPFLASMHATGKSGQPALLSDLTAEMPLRIHATCHLAAVLLCAAAILFGSHLMARVGAAFGLAGALAFAVFALRVVKRLKTAAS